MPYLALIISLLFPESAVERANAEFILASGEGQIAKIRSLSLQADMAAVDSNGRTALLAAGEYGQRAAFAEILAIANERVRSAVARLPVEGQPSVVTVMRVVDTRRRLFETANPGGVTPLMLAAANGWDDLVRILIGEGAKASVRDKDGFSAADYADESGLSRLAAYLRRQP